MAPKTAPPPAQTTPGPPADAAIKARQARINSLILNLAAIQNPTKEQQKHLKTLNDQWDTLDDELKARQAYLDAKTADEKNKSQQQIAELEKKTPKLLGNEDLANTTLACQEKAVTDLIRPAKDGQCNGKQLYKQEMPMSCGEAAARMVIQTRTGKDISEAELRTLSQKDGVLGYDPLNGTISTSVVHILQQQGAVDKSINPATAGYPVNDENLKKALSTPPAILRLRNPDHFVVVDGFDPKNPKVLLIRDPWDGCRTMEIGGAEWQKRVADQNSGGMILPLPLPPPTPATTAKAATAPPANKAPGTSAKAPPAPQPKPGEKKPAAKKPAGKKAAEKKPAKKKPAKK